MVEGKVLLPRNTKQNTIQEGFKGFIRYLEECTCLEFKFKSTAAIEYSFVLIEGKEGKKGAVNNSLAGREYPCMEASVSFILYI